MSADPERYDPADPIPFTMRERYARLARVGTDRQRALAATIVAEIDRHNAAGGDYRLACESDALDAARRQAEAIGAEADALKAIIAALQELEGATDGRR